MLVVLFLQKLINVMIFNFVFFRFFFFVFLIKVFHVLHFAGMGGRRGAERQRGICLN